MKEEKRKEKLKGRVHPQELEQEGNGKNIPRGNEGGNGKAEVNQRSSVAN